MNPPTAEERVARALADIRHGRPAILLHGGVGYLCFAGARASADLVAFAVRHTSGYVRVALGVTRAAQLILPPVGADDADRVTGGYAVSVDAVNVAATGISAADRAYTIAMLARADATPSDFTRPGHVVPLRAHDGGVLVRPGLAEAALDLSVQAGLIPATALAELVSEAHPTELADELEVELFASAHGLALISIADLVAWRRAGQTRVHRQGAAPVATEHGQFTAVTYDDRVGGRDQVALVCGDISNGLDVMVAVHAECVAGELFGSLTCNCRDRLQWSLGRVGEYGRGVVIYLRGAGLRHSAGHAAAAADGTDLIATAILTDLGIRSTRPVPTTLATRP